MQRMTARVHDALTQLGHKIASKIRQEYEELTKDEPSESTLDRLITATMPKDLFVHVSDFLVSELERQYRDAGLEVLTQLGIADQNAMLSSVDKLAVQYAEKRAAILVGRQLTIDENGVRSFIDNPNPKWSIAESTRDMLRTTVSQAVEEGWSAQKLADEIQSSYAFGEARAETIARTELAFASSESQRQTAIDTGAVAKRNLLGSEHAGDVPAGDECDDATNDGIIGIDDDFSAGGYGPPWHPRCVCSLELIWQDDPRAAPFINQ